MNFLKRILSYLREEIEIIEDDELAKNEETEKKATEKPAEAMEVPLPLQPEPDAAPEKPALILHAERPAAQQISARVAYRYPTVKRYDHEEMPRMDRKKRPVEKEEAPDPAPRKKEPKKPVAYSTMPRIGSSAFKPTPIPSPIYGFRPRPNQEGAEPVYEEEKKQEPLVLVPKNNSSAGQPAELKKTVSAAPELKEKPAAEKKEEMQEAEIKVFPSPEDRAAKRSERRHSPFNVVMLKKDREKLRDSAKKPEKPAETKREQVLEKQAETNSEKAPEKPAEASPETLPAKPFFPETAKKPPMSFLTPPAIQSENSEWVQEKSKLLYETLKSFNIKAEVTGVTTGPSITRFEVTPAIGVKVSKIVGLADDIKRSLAARTIRIEAPIPGTQVVGIEVPNEKSRPVFLSEIISGKTFQHSDSPLAAALGLDIAGQPAVLDLQKMPHGLIAGATGSGKSVCINSILVSLLYKAAPHELKLLLIDPKMVELTPYNGIPHLASPVITDVKTATAALKWAVEEMERRYQLFVHAGVRDMAAFNAKAAQSMFNEPHLPYIVVIIDELADLMMMAPSDVEESISRLAQKARACGIHLIVATQRPSVDVITGLIKANIPTRIAFSVSSQVDSRTILDKAGAEKLLGKGDMLFLNNGSSEAVRLQGTFVTNEEIDEVVRFVSTQQQPEYLFQQEELLAKEVLGQEEDELFYDACELVVRQEGASTSMLQRHLKVGYNRAAKLIEMMEEKGLIAEQRAGRPRELLVSKEDLEEYIKENK